MWGAIASAAGSIAGALLGSNAQKEANEANRDIAKDQMAFQAGMSSTSYQRATADMRTAGLNPMLAYQQGGASTPTGASAQMQSEYTGALEKGVSSAMDAIRLKKEIAAVDSQNDLNRAAEQTQKSQAVLNSSSAKAQEANAIAATQNALKSATEQKLLESQYGAVSEKAKYDKEMYKQGQKYSDYDSFMNRVKSATGVLNDAASILKPRINIFNQRDHHYDGGGSAPWKKGD